MNRPSTHKFVDDGAILLGLPISEELAADFRDAIRVLESRRHATATLFINSPGGLVSATETIIDAIAKARVRIDTICVGMAAGSAAFVLAAGAQRTMTSDAVVSFSPFTAGDRFDTTEIEAAQNRMILRAARHTGMIPADLAHWVSRSACPPKPELVRTGFVHAII